MTVLVDADSCPRDLRAILLRAAMRRRLTLRFLANRPMDLGTGIAAEVVDNGTVDEEILRRIVRDGEPVLVITRDIPLAEAVLQRGGWALNDRGTEFDQSSIAERRSLRDRAEVIRALGIETMDRRRSYGEREVKAFADALDRVLTRLGH